MERLQNEIKLAGVEYNEPNLNTKGELNMRIDDIKLNALAQIEALIQLILVNPELSKAVFFNAQEQVEILSSIAKQLRGI